MRYNISSGLVLLGCLAIKGGSKSALPPPPVEHATGAIIPLGVQDAGGLVVNESKIEYATGLLLPPELEEDEVSENFFNKFRRSKKFIPSSYSSVDDGYATSVKNQGQCGSCTAFSTHAVVEICFNKLLGVSGDLSEQQLIDCAYGTEGAFGCDGSFIDSYFKYGSRVSLDPAYELQYPYKGPNTSYECPSNLPKSQIGALFGNPYRTYKADEELMKRLVYELGAVISSVKAERAFQGYISGVFSGCNSTLEQDHAITVVGYGNEDGQDYWLAKNSWGPNWGDRGYIRIKRGVNMCGIGKHVAVADCKRSSRPVIAQAPNPPTNFGPTVMATTATAITTSTMAIPLNP